MIRLLLSILWKLIMVVVLSGVNVFAGDLTVNIRQPFKAGGRDFPAGHYRVTADDQNDQSIHLQNLDSKIDNEIQFTTRLAPREGQWGAVVFDKLNNELYLSEIYIVGMDGYFFQGMPGKHRHMVIKEEIG